MSIFSKIPIKRPKRSVFNLSYSSKLSLPFGKLIPIMCEKVVPGDKFVHRHEFIMRFAPFFGQVFQQYKVCVDYFFVPSRLLWSSFEKFLADDQNTIVHPFIYMNRLYDGTNSMLGSLCDYFNLPTGDENNPLNPNVNLGANVKLDVLPFAAYLKIFLDYYADENLCTWTYNNVTYDLQTVLDLFDTMTEQPGLTYSTNLYKLFSLINRGIYPTGNPPTSFNTSSWFPFTKAYPKDYFTSALPFAQRGPIVQIPLNGSGDVIVTTDQQGARYQNVIMSNSASATGEHVITLYGDDDVAASQNIQGDLTNPATITFKAVNVNGTATITDLRTAMAVQSWLEKNARSGVRYKEQLSSHFGVKSRDYRLQRSELLQRSKSSVSIGEVFTTAQDDSGDFIPGLGVSTATGSNAVRPWKHFFEEHGYVIGLMCVYPTAAYSQGIPRQFLELDKFDYYWPEFQHIGEQEIKNMELYYRDGIDSPDNAFVFGYTPRYAQYKSRTNQVHGDFRESLKFMLSSRKFANPPILNKEFIDIDPAKNDLYRVFNATGDYKNAFPCFCDFFHDFKAIRPMSYFGNPRII